MLRCRFEYGENGRPIVGIRRQLYSVLETNRKFGEQLQAQVQTPSTDPSDFISSLPLLMSHLELPEGEIIQDERGVRLARVQED